MYERLLAVACNNESADHSAGLPANFYTDPGHFELEKRQIFYKSWICIGHDCMAREPGSYFIGRVVDQEVFVRAAVVVGQTERKTTKAQSGRDEQYAHED